MKSALALSAMMATSASAFAPTGSTSSSTATQLSESKADLQSLAKNLNPIVPFWDPMSLVDQGFWGYNEERTIGWLRQSEIKHGRIAMAAFVGYCVQSNFVFPWNLTRDGMPMPGTDLSPPEQWDALPTASKLQILAFVGFLEWFSELSDMGEPHYTKGGKPGKYPDLKGNIPHFVPFNLYDPLGWSTGRTAEQNERGLIMEINNGRLAMIGIFGFLAEAKVPGSVPLLEGIVKPYSGDFMAPLQPISFMS